MYLSMLADTSKEENSPKVPKPAVCYLSMPLLWYGLDGTGIIQFYLLRGAVLRLWDIPYELHVRGIRLQAHIDLSRLVENAI